MMPLFVEDIYLQQTEGEVPEECSNDESVDEEDDYNDVIKGDESGENNDEVEDIDDFSAMKLRKVKKM